MTTDIAEEFEDNFETHKAIAAHRLKCLADLGEGTILHIHDGRRMVALSVDGEIFINADDIELMALNNNPEEQTNDDDE
jgi:hypothetical protein